VRRVLLATAVACVGLIGAESALACSCVAITTRDALAQSDAAMNAKLAEIRPTDASNPNADLRFRYRVLRVFKGARNYERGDTLTIRVDPNNSCSPDGREGRRYGLLLDRHRKRLTTNVCGLRSPKALRRAATRPDGKAKGKLCGRG
jgi:hypothetical protein